MRQLISFVLIITMIFMFTFSFSDPITIEENNSVSSVSDVKDNLIDLSNEEKKVLEELFLIIQDIKEMEEIERITEIEIDDLKVDIEDIEDLIDEETKMYEDNLDIMQEVLKSYQRNGSITYLDLILSSNNLETLLRRFNFIRDISRNTTTLLEDIENSKEKLVKDKEKLDNTLVLVETRQDELKLALVNTVSLKEDLEIKLAALQEDKSKYEEYLSKLENSWEDISPIFSDTINMLVKIIEDGNLPEETIDVTFTLSGVVGVIEEENFRNILALQSFPTTVELVFTENKVELLMPEINIYMSGTLEILNSQALIFNMTEGQYLGMKLEKSAMEELFKFGYLEFNFHNLLGKTTIKSMKMNDGNLVLYINPVYF